MARHVDYVRTRTLPAYSQIMETNHINESNYTGDYARMQEPPPVIRRREKNKKDNSANRRSRPASWFVSHFSFDKLFNRGNVLGVLVMLHVFPIHCTYIYNCPHVHVPTGLELPSHLSW